MLLADGTNDYIYGPFGIPIEQYRKPGSVAIYLHPDQYGSIRMLTDSSGQVVGAYAYDAHGTTVAHTGADASPLGWGGQYRDGDTGLYYLRARYFDPTAATFTSRDPLVDLTGSAYGFGDNDPVDEGDPSGLVNEPEITGGAPGAGVGAFGGAAGADGSGAGGGLGESAGTARGPDGVPGAEAAGFDAAEQLALESVGVCPEALENALAAGHGASGDIGATTTHGAERVAGAGATRGGVLTPEQIIQVRGEGQLWTQADGASVRALQNSAGRYDIVIDGYRGLITTFKNLSQKSLDRLAKNCGWTQ